MRIILFFTNRYTIICQDKLMIKGVFHFYFYMCEGEHRFIVMNPQSQWSYSNIKEQKCKIKQSFPSGAFL